MDDSDYKRRITTCTAEQEEMPYEEIKRVNGFCILSDRPNVCGAFKAVVTARIAIE